MMSSSRNQYLFLVALVIGVIIGATDAKAPSKMTAGADAQDGEFPWMVTLGAYNGGALPYHSCGGAIITSRHILTAGHCVYGRNVRSITVRGGMTDLRDRRSVFATVVNAYINPGYIPEIKDVRVVDNDIAILVLDKPLPLGGLLNKIALPNSPPRNHQRGVVSGWGLLRQNPTVHAVTLKKDQIEVLDDASCRQWSPPINPRRFCGQKPYGTILPGDSGSPLVSEGKVIGIVSSSWNANQVPSFYVNVSFYLGWIKAVIGNTQ